MKKWLAFSLALLLILPALALPALAEQVPVPLLKRDGDQLILICAEDEIARWTLAEGPASLAFMQLGDYIVVRIRPAETPGEERIDEYFSVDEHYGYSWQIEGEWDEIAVYPSVTSFAFRVELLKTATVEQVVALAPVFVHMDGAVEKLAAILGAEISGTATPEYATIEEVEALLTAYLESELTFPESIPYFDLSRYFPEIEEEEDDAPVHTPGDGEEK